MSVKRSIILRVRIAFLLVAIFGVMVIVKIGKIQIIDGKKLKERALTTTYKERQVKATRGNIYAADGSLLATSLPFYRVAFDPTILKSDQEFDDQIDSLAMKLAEFFQDKSQVHYERELRNARLKRKRYVRIGDKKINYHEKKQLAQFPIFRKGRYRGGVIFEKIDRRFRPFGDLARRTIGNANVEEDSLGNEVYGGVGLEYSFNDELAGDHGYGMFQKIAGIWVPMVGGGKTEPENGNDIYTTIDINIQDVAENALLRILEENDAEYGTVILMEVKTGEIKAMANLGRTEDGKGYYESYNYAVGDQGRTEPGSTFKLASMIALFEKTNNKLKLTDSMDCENGRHLFHDMWMTDAKEGGYGMLSIQEVMEKSSNIGVSKLVDKYFSENPQQFIDYLYDMGMADTLGFQIKGEAKPYIKKWNDDSWSGTTLPWMSIGYELKLAPLQTLALYNAIANNGVKIQPIIIKEVRKADELVAKFETKSLNKKICSQETLKKIRKQLEGVVLKGTANNIKTSKYKIAGKTGTAQKFDQVKKKYTKVYSTSFAGYFPADNPKYSCIVVVDSPKGFQRQGSNVAAPVFREIADKVYSRDLVLHKETTLSPPPKTGVFPSIKAGNAEEIRELCNEFKISTHSGDNGEFVVTKVKNNSINLVSKKVTDGLVPDVTGLRLKDALYLLENQGLTVKFSGSGRVVSQSQRPGIQALRKSEIILTLE